MRGKIVLLILLVLSLTLVSSSQLSMKDISDGNTETYDKHSLTFELNKLTHQRDEGIMQVWIENPDLSIIQSNTYNVEIYDTKGKQFGYNFPSKAPTNVNFLITSDKELDKKGNKIRYLVNEKKSNNRYQLQQIDRNYQSVDFSALFNKNPLADFVISKRGSAYMVSGTGITDFDPEFTEDFSTDIGGTHTKSEWVTERGIQLISSVLFLDFNEQGKNGSTRYDHNYTISGATYNATGGVNGTGAYEFDGINDHLDLGKHTSLSIENNMTITAWVKLKGDYTTTQAIVANYEDLGTDQANYFYRYGVSDGNFTFNHNSVASRVDGTTGFRDTDWHHIAVVRNGTTGSWTVTFYIDGVLDTAVSSADNPDGSSRPTTIGAIDAEGYQIQFFNGTIDNINIFNTALSLSEIQTIQQNSESSTIYTSIGNYTSAEINGTMDSEWRTITTTCNIKNVTDTTDTDCSNNVELEYRTSNDNSSWSSWYDATNNGDETYSTLMTNTSYTKDHSTDLGGTYTQTEHYNGTQLRTPYAVFDHNSENKSEQSKYQFTSTFNSVVYNATGGVNGTGAYEFGGSQANITTNTVTYSLGNSFTLQAWVRLLSNATFGVIVTTNNATTMGAELSWSDAGCTGAYDNRFFLRVYDSAGNWVGRFTTNEYGDDGWHHVAAVYNTTNIDVYVDGVLDNGNLDKAGCAGAAHPVNRRIAYNPHILIGSRTDGYSWNGTIDNVIIHNRSLTLSEIQAYIGNSTALPIFSTEGNYTSTSTDGTISNHLQTIEITCNVMNVTDTVNTNCTDYIEVYADSSDDNSTWDGWTLGTDNSDETFSFTNVKGRYLRYRLEMTSDGGNNTPVITNVNLNTSYGVNGINGEYFQYRVTMNGTGNETPVISQIDLVAGVNSGGTISATGTTQIIDDITETGTAYTLSTGNITFDCNDQTINYGSGGSGYGFQVNAHANNVIQDCTITDNGGDEEILIDSGVTGLNITDITLGANAQITDNSNSVKHLKLTESVGYIDWNITNVTLTANSNGFGIAYNKGIHIGDKIVSVNSTLFPNLNSTATIKMYGVGNQILKYDTYTNDRDTAITTATNCTDCVITETGMEGDRNYIIFTTTSFSTYIANGSSCGYVNEDLTLTENINSSGTCLTINASNIVIDGAGYNLTYGINGSALNGITSNGFNNVTLKNIGVVDGNGSASASDGIVTTNSDNWNITNITCTHSRPTYCIHIDAGSDNNYITDSTVNALLANSRGINLDGGDNNQVLRNTITTANNNAAYAFQIGDTSINNSVKHNTITTTGGTSIAMLLGTGDAIIENNTINSASESCIYLFQNANNYQLINNNCTSTDASFFFDATGNSFINYLLFNNEYGQINFTNTADGGLLKDLEFDSTSNNFALGNNIVINNNSFSFNASDFSAQINTSAEITIEGQTWIELTDVYYLPGVETDESVIRSTGSSCVDAGICSITDINTFTVNHWSSYAGIGGVAPTVDTAVLNSTQPSTNNSNQNLTAYTTTTDADGDSVKVIYNWLLNGSNVIVANLPFEMNNHTTTNNTKDYVGNLVELSNGATWKATEGYDGKGVYYYSGSSGDAITIADNDVIDGDNDFSYFAWVNTSDNTRKMWLSKSQTPGYYSDIDVGTFRCRVRSVSNPTLASSTSSLSDGQYHHLGCTFDLDGNVSLYVDGVKEDSVDMSTASTMKNTDELILGGLTATSFNFNGHIDDLTFWNRSLTPEQIQLLYNNRTDIIHNTTTKQGENWSYTATPNDGIVDGTTVTSNYLYVREGVTTDTTPPTIISLNEYPTDPFTYVSGQTYNFNATITDETALHNVTFEFNAVNYTPTNVSGIFVHELTDLAVGTYEYEWFAQDSSGNFNNQTGSYTVSKATSSVNLLLGGADNDTTVSVPTTLLITGSTITGGNKTVLLYSNITQINTSLSSVSDSVLFDTAGHYNYTVIYESNENYTASRESHLLIVNNLNKVPWAESMSLAPVAPNDEDTIYGSAKYRIDSFYILGILQFKWYVNGSLYSEENVTGLSNNQWANVSITPQAVNSTVWFNVTAYGNYTNDGLFNSSGVKILLNPDLSFNFTTTWLEENFTLTRPDRINLSVTLQDLDGDVNVAWYVNNELASNTSGLNFNSNNYVYGLTYLIHANMTDGTNTQSETWRITIGERSQMYLIAMLASVFVSFLFLYFAFHLDKDHFFLKILSIFFSLATLMLIPGVIMNGVVATQLTLYKVILGFFGIFIMYFVLFLFYRWVKQSEGLVKWLKRIK